MAIAMYLGEGIGLAAPQIGDDRRIVLVDPSNGDSAAALRVMVNPVILVSSPEKASEKEGCLSLPGSEVFVSRPIAIEVQYQTITGEVRHEAMSGLVARITQHEIDHLNGITLLKHKRKRK